MVLRRAGQGDAPGSCGFVEEKGALVAVGAALRTEEAVMKYWKKCLITAVMIVTGLLAGAGVQAFGCRECGGDPVHCINGNGALVCIEIQGGCIDFDDCTY